MFVTNWISTTKIQKISEITNFFRHYFLSRTEVVLYMIRYRTGEERKGLREVFRCFWNNQTKYLLPLHSEKKQSDE